MKRHDVTWEELNPEPYDNTDAVALSKEVDRLREGIEGIAARLDGWTDHDGIGPAEALLALIGPVEG